VTSGISGTVASSRADDNRPTVGSITHGGATALTNAASVDYTVTFSDNVSDVDTGDFSLTKTGTADGAIASVSSPCSPSCTVTVDTITGDGTLRLDLSDNDSINVSGQVSGGSRAQNYSWGESYTIDKTAPAVSTPDLTAATDSGASDTDNSTSDDTPDFSGTAEADATVEVFYGGTNCLGTATATGGDWSLTATAIPAGTQSITAKATDAAGNVSAASAALSVTIDTTAPTTQIDSKTPSTTPTKLTTMTFTCSGADTGGSGVNSYQCKLDTGTYASCTSPQNLTSLSDAAHTFSVKAIDEAGNEDATPAS